MQTDQVGRKVRSPDFISSRRRAREFSSRAIARYKRCLILWKTAYSYLAVSEVVLLRRHKRLRSIHPVETLRIVTFMCHVQESSTDVTDYSKRNDHGHRRLGEGDCIHNEQM